ncbi:MAG TPA: hypothetical protein DCZ69_14440 [Syntrophobacteraceae bacterium]|nr:hypothetical protein [Syntrophobacteraceae bacterium]
MVGLTLSTKRLKRPFPSDWYWKSKMPGGILKGIQVVVIGILMFAAAGCGTSGSSKFYVLNALAGSEMATPAVTARAGVAVGVGPVKIPEYLDRLQIVTRSTLSSLQLAEFERWAEPLEKSIPRILAENLSALLGSDQIAIHPWPNALQVEYQVVVEVNRLDGTLGQNALLDARWTLLADKGRRIVVRKNSTISEPASGGSYEGLVMAQSRALTQLSKEIATAIREAAQGVSNP